MEHDIKLSGICTKIAGYSAEELVQFFKSFFTEKEISALEGRVNLIDLLLKKNPQREIAKKLGISFTLITRGSHELQNGIGKEFFPKFFKKKKKNVT